MAADDDLHHAVLGDRGDLHDHDLARGGVESGLLPGVGSGSKVRGVAGGGVPAVDEVGIVGDGASDAFLGFDDTGEILRGSVGAERAGFLGHVGFNRFVQFATAGFGRLNEGGLLGRRDLLRRNGGASDGGREEEGVEQTHGEG